MLDVIPDLMADLEGDVRNVLLTLARVWFTLHTGEIAAKDVAADWAIARLPEGRGDALRRARAGYLGDLEDSWDDEAMVAARADAAAIRASIEASRTAAPAPEDYLSSWQRNAPPGYRVLCRFT